MSDKKIEIEWEVDDRKVQAAVDRMASRMDRLDGIHGRAWDKLARDGGDRTKGELNRDANKIARDVVREGDKEARVEARQRATADMKREREERQARSRDARAEDRVAAWGSAARNRKYLEDEAEKKRKAEEPGALKRFFSGGKGGGVAGVLEGMGPVGRGALGAARVVGGAALGALGGGGIIGTLASTILGPLGALGGIVTAVVGTIMKGGAQQVEHTRGLVDLMRTEAIITGGRGDQGSIQSSMMDGAKYGFQGREMMAMRASARRGGKGAAFGIDNEVLARGALNDVDAGVFGRYAGLSQRFGVMTGGMRGAERLGALGKSIGLGGSAIPELVAGGYEQLAGRGLNVDSVPFESLLGRAMTKDNFQAGGERSVRGLMAIEGLRGDARDQIGAPFKDLAGNLQLMRAYQAAGKSGKSGFGFISAAMEAAESPDMGADSTRDFWRSRGGDFAAVMGGAVGGMTQAESRDLMGSLGDEEAGPAGGKFGIPGGKNADWKQYADVFAWDSVKDMRQLGNPNDLKEIVELQRNMAEISRSMASAAGSLASAANSILGR